MVKVLIKKLNPKEKIIIYNNFDNKIIAMFSEFNKRYDAHIQRSPSYLDWRYNKFLKSKLGVSFN